jgi:hypothetical protein
MIRTVDFRPLLSDTCQSIESIRIGVCSQRLHDQRII